MMKGFQYRGKRIKVRDKDIILNFVLFRVFLIFGICFLLFNYSNLSAIDWNEFHLEDIEPLFQIEKVLGSFITTLFICLGIGYYYYRYRVDFMKQLIHRQKIARMILDNGWCDKETIQKEGFFKDLPSSKTKEKIINFPKCYYQLKEGIIHIHIEIILNKAQDQLLRLEKKLESAFYCELIDKELLEGYLHYSFLYDTISRRITIDEVTIKDGQMKLMESVYWDYDQLPHMLVAGGTGGGKTYFLLTLILALSKVGANLYILDPKNADLADLETVLPNVYHRKEDMLGCLNQFFTDMMKRSEEMKTMKGYKTGENYAYLGLKPNFMVFDEYVAFMELLGRESLEVMNKIKQIVMLGRQSGFFIILACQRPDAKYLGDGSRDQFNCRIALGRMSELGYNMLFGEQNKDYFLKPIKGRGYIDLGVSVISEFYTPLVPKGYDFLSEIGKYYHLKESVEEP